MRRQLRRDPAGAYYEPLDELLEHPHVRILRGVRYRWAATRELLEDLGVLHDTSLANAYNQHLLRMAREGLLQRRVSHTIHIGRVNEYTITDAGRAHLDAVLSRAEPERELGDRAEDDPKWLTELAIRDYRINYARTKRTKHARARAA